MTGVQTCALPILQPLRALLFILRNAIALREYHAEIVLRLGPAAGRGFAKPRKGLRGVLLHALAFLVEKREVVLAKGSPASAYARTTSGGSTTAKSKPARAIAENSSVPERRSNVSGRTMNFGA